ncbi:DUF6088 family protein [Tunicatimonas pelagia]|uniref:DUF6088 family protein n=1 Tax=Tunicatimonas pelagia TaxID=931531 RepID=UPI0026669287|nr:DUF6088 family protein [Tunicatimonas pelagia]WKN44900.1 DUF6088 family protein [Tunicatimonas pelagia]
MNQTRMSVAEKIQKSVIRLREGTTFKYQNLGLAPSEYSAAAKAIERLIRQGIIKRASTGVFYKPKQTAFGELRPREEELLRPYLFEGQKRIAYITGDVLYNRMGLTTQIPKAIKVASRAKRVTTKIGKMSVKPVKSYVDVTNENYRLLEILDALKDFKTIPDLDKRSAIIQLKRMIKTLSASERSQLIKYARKYPPRTRALLGALLTALKKSKETSTLRESLNPLSSYELGIDSTILPSVTQWNID